MKKIVSILILTLVFISCGGGEVEGESTCPKDYHIKEKGSTVCIHDAVDCTGNPGTFDNNEGDCLDPCKDIDCGEGGTCKGETFKTYSCECETPNTLGDDKICHAPNQFSDHKCYNEIVEILEPKDVVATTDAKFTCDNGLCTVVIDATAGGHQTPGDKPWIYINLAKQEKVSITDTDAFNSTEWDLAIRRNVVRANGNDSGVGTVEVARADGASFDTTIAVPTSLDQEFISDSFMDETCTIIKNQINVFITAVGDWYKGGGSMAGINPRDYLYFVKSNGITYKLKFISYSSGILTIKYLAL